MDRLTTISTAAARLRTGDLHPRDLVSHCLDRIRVFDYAKYNLTIPIIEPYEMSLNEVTIALGKCYMTFYAHKMKEVLALPEGFKRRYMLSAFKQMMKDYGEQFDFLGGNMPKMPKF